MLLTLSTHLEAFGLLQTYVSPPAMYNVTEGIDHIYPLKIVSHQTSCMDQRCSRSANLCFVFSSTLSIYGLRSWNYPWTYHFLLLSTLPFFLFLVKRASQRDLTFSASIIMFLFSSNTYAGHSFFRRNTCHTVLYTFLASILHFLRGHSWLLCTSVLNPWCFFSSPWIPGGHRPCSAVLVGLNHSFMHAFSDLGLVHMHVAQLHLAFSWVYLYTLILPAHHNWNLGWELAFSQRSF
jgi:hypothetical protein